MAATRSQAVPVTVIGAGPYGLATAAHLRARGVPHRVFGEPMDSWRSRMPAGMFLKSTPSASSISDPSGACSLDRFRAAEGRRSQGDLHPVPLDEFVRYGLWFQQQCVPDLERTVVRRIEARAGQFQVTLESGEDYISRSVVLATGLGPFAHIPPELADLAREGLASHPAEHADLGRFAGQRVAVVGAGQSALESAALLHEAGAVPTVLARTQELLFGTPPSSDLPAERPLSRRLVKPASPLGPGWSLRAFSGIPGSYRHLPAPAREHFLRTVLGPSGAWWLRDRVHGRVDVLTGRSVRSAVPAGGGARLTLADRDGGTAVLEADHVLSATGYRVDLDRMELLAPGLRGGLWRSGRAPHLSAGFESSVSGLYFTGLPAAATFGPVLRFVCGTGFAAGRLSRAVAARG
ncbi:NAD(P)-binding domain-containing protein [Streptacidiphilus sp. N1-12]|uniref:NAD(P)-binding domain-containing protein n=2 Tax=Streptacidiphilus alkalitolerans TaxID=3342712 RepID=A0ABV6W7A6_9ACTN